VSPWRKLDLSDLFTLVAEHAAEVVDGKTVGLALAREDVVFTEGGTDDFIVELQKVQFEHEQGPIWDAVTKGQTQLVDDIWTMKKEWSRFAAMCEEAGVRAGASVPLFDETGSPIGTINVGLDEPGELSPEQMRKLHRIGQLSSTTLAQAEQARSATELVTQLETAFVTRPIKEQAKGYAARALGVTPHEAFLLIRKHARNRRVTVGEVSKEILSDPEAYRALLAP